LQPDARGVRSQTVALHGDGSDLIVGAACRNAERGLRLRASSKTPEENKKVVSFTPAGDDGKARGISFSDSGDYTTEASQIDGDISKGKSELEQVKALTDDEAEKLREKLSKQIDKAMLEEQAKILEAYDAKTQGLLDEMKAQRDIIREENEKLQALAEEVQGGKFWKGKAKKKTNMTLTIATFLAYTFAFASVNEIYKGVAGDGLTFVGGLKAVVDLFLAVASTYIANKGPQKMLDEENEAREAAEAEAERLKKLNNGGQTNNNIDDGNPTIIDGYPVSKKPLDGFK